MITTTLIAPIVLAAVAVSGVHSPLSSPPVVSVTVGADRPFEDELVEVLGLVRRPGTVKFTEKMTVADAITAAGGLIDTVESVDVIFVVVSGKGKDIKEVLVDAAHKLMPNDGVVVKRKK